MLTSYTVHDCRHSKINRFAFQVGDFMLSDYGSGPVVAEIRADGRPWGVAEPPFNVGAVASVLDEMERRIAEADYDATIADFEAMTGRM